MRLFRKDVAVKNPNHVINKSIVLVCRRYMPKGRKWSVEVHSGWPMDKTFQYNSMSKCEALAIASKAINANIQQLGCL